MGKSSRGESSKTGRNQGVRLDYPHSHAIIRRRVKGLQPKEKAFPIKANDYRKWWHWAVAKVGVSQPPHSCRHTGASYDVAMGYRTMEQAMHIDTIWTGCARCSSYQGMGITRAYSRERGLLTPAYLLGLLAMIKCSICSYQCDNWYVSNRKLACHINFSWGVRLVSLLASCSRVALAWHFAKCGAPFGVPSKCSPIASVL